MDISPPPYIVLHKPMGQTPLQALEEWKMAHPEYAHLSMTYAGRLDPMASGKLLVLLGEECKQRDTYNEFDKEYEIEVVLDLGTDTGDALGLATYEGTETKASTEELQRSFKIVLGSHEVPYPIFSSKTVGGQPLFMYALANTLSSITIPEHTETIYKIALLQRNQLSREALRNRIQSILALVPKTTELTKEIGADFRQDEIRARWGEVFSNIPEREFTYITVRVSCASGTYMRTLAGRLGTVLSTSGFALSINRTKIGTYRNVGVLGRWTKEY